MYIGKFYMYMSIPISYKPGDINYVLYKLLMTQVIYRHTLYNNEM